MKNIITKICWGFALQLLCAGIVWGTEGFSSIGWQSAHVPEGTKIDAASGFLNLETGVEHDGFSIGAGLIQGLRENYNELELALGYGWDVQMTEFGIGLSRIEYPSLDDHGSWEVAADVTIPMHQYVAIFLDGVYDFDDINGGFLETGIRFTPPNPGASLFFEPYALVGWDWGFVSGPRRLNENHIQVGIESEWQIAGNASVFADINHSTPLDNLDDIDEKSATWGGLGIGFTY